jgi:hypothetical protein
LAFPNSHILAESLGAVWQHTIEELRTHLKLIAGLPLIHKTTPTLPPATSPETLPNHFSDNITVETRPSDPDWDLPLNTDGRKEGRITRIASRYAYYSGRVFVRHFSGPGLVSMLCVVASGWPARPLSLMRWTP